MELLSGSIPPMTSTTTSTSGADYLAGVVGVDAGVKIHITLLACSAGDAPDLNGCPTARAPHRPPARGATAPDRRSRSRAGRCRWNPSSIQGKRGTEGLVIPAQRSSRSRAHDGRLSPPNTATTAGRSILLCSTTSHTRMRPWRRKPDLARLDLGRGMSRPGCRVSQSLRRCVGVSWGAPASRRQEVYRACKSRTDVVRHPQSIARRDFARDLLTVPPCKASPAPARSRSTGSL